MAAVKPVRTVFQLHGLTQKVQKTRPQFEPTVTFKNAIFREATLQDTIYRDNPDEVDDWGKFYLPETVTMTVFGVVEGIPCPCEELVLMTCDVNKQVYAYDGEELHLVALSMQQLHDEGMEYPGFKTYYNGEAFKDMTREDWDEVWRGPVGLKLRDEHNKMVEARKANFLKNLHHSRQQKP